MTSETPDIYADDRGFGFVTIAAWVCALLWIIGTLLMAWSWAPSGGFSGLPSPMLIAIAALAIIPAVLFLLLGMMAKWVLAAAARTSALIEASNALTRPDDAVQGKVTTLAQGIRSQIIGVDSELKAAMDRLAGMENVLRGHTDALAGSHLASTRQTGEIAQRLSEEREGLKAISSSFDERMGALSRLLTEHSDRLAHATQVAEQKIQEARVSVEGAAAKINASSEIVRDNALAATDSLSAGETKIAALGDAIQTQADALDAINARHAADMADLVSRLEDEQARMRETMDARLESMRDMSLSAKLSADSLNDAGEAGKRTIEALAGAASLADNAVRERFKEMEDMVSFSEEKADSITGRASQRVRDSLSLTRLEISRIEDDMRDLEQRLTQRNDDFERRETAVDVTPKPAWRKSLLRFRPADTEEAPAAKAQTEDAPEALKLTAPEPEIKPAPKPEDTAALEIPRVSDNAPTAPAAKAVQISEPAPDITPDLIPEPITDFIPDETLQIETPPADHVLPIDLPDTPSLSASRIDPPQLRARKEKSGWSLRSLFGGQSQTETPQPVEDDFADWPAQCKDMVASLTDLGLAPGAVVEAGTIIEAVNMRASQGSDAMRKTVALRLGEPVRHLQSVFSDNPQIRSRAQSFATRYYQVIAAQNDDREGIRKQLETDAGRAFLLCDAALG